MRKNSSVWNLLCKGRYGNTLKASTTPIIIASTLFALVVAATAYSKTAELPEHSLKLHQYKLNGAAIKLEGVDDNASGLSYNPETGTLFAIINNPEYLLELNTSGQVLRKILLSGFHDTEAVVSLGLQRFAILEERRHSISIVTISSDTTELVRSEQKSITFNILGKKKNQGLEGIAYDSNAKRLFVVNEKSPKQLIAIEGIDIDGTEPNNSLSMSRIWADDSNQQRFLQSSDYSGLHYDNNSRHLLMLSDESRELSEIDQHGNTLSRLDLSWWSEDLTSSVPQAEGVTMDHDGNIYLLSEPNLLYRFTSG
jgi:uncharacterized protein YjiK